LSHPQPFFFFCFSYFSGWGLAFLLGLASIFHSLPPKKLGCVSHHGWLVGWEGVFLTNIFLEPQSPDLGFPSSWDYRSTSLCPEIFTLSQ
jgi:hypothetical protein